jgi:prevent-host-death family protein
MDKTVNIHHAKTHLSSLITEVEEGHEISIARAGKPVAKIVAAAKKKRKPAQAKRNLAGKLRGKIRIAPNFDDPLPEDILAAFRGERD